MKGIILAGGTGSRLFPATLAVNKQLLPVYDKPMIYYPISTLMLSGIRDILVISAPEYLDSYRRLIGDGSQLGLRVSYAEQAAPRGLAEAFLIGRRFIAGEPCCLILGDNLFYGAGLKEKLLNVTSRAEGATIFAYRVHNPEDYGVVTFDEAHRPVSVVEKPERPTSPWAVTGLYFFDGHVADIAAKITPSSRGELEITDVIRAYLDTGMLAVELLGRGYAWLDTGTHDSMLEAAEFVRTIQHRQGVQIACLEEIAYEQKWIDRRILADRCELHANTSYGRYLRSLLDAPPPR